MPKGFPDWVARKVAVWEKADWSIVEGDYKVFIWAGTIPANSSESEKIYTVPEGRVLLITDMSVARYEGEGNVAFILVNLTMIEWVAAIGGVQGASLVFKTPAPFFAGEVVGIDVRNVSGTDGKFIAAVRGYEFER